MIKNYLKAALASMKRRKWFTVLTLFSIAISLVVVISIASFWNMISAPMRPELKKDRIFYLDDKYYQKSNGSKFEYSLAKKVMPADFYSTTIHQLEIPVLSSAFMGQGVQIDFQKDGKGRSLQSLHTDDQFFSVFEFEFIDGKPYNKNSFASKDDICVISEEMAIYFFGTPFCTGKVINASASNLTVVGVFKQSTHKSPVYADVYIVSKKATIESLGHVFGIRVVFLCKTANDRESLDKEIGIYANKYSVRNETVSVSLKTRSSVETIIQERFQYDSNKKIRYAALLLLILILPVFCLIDILKNHLDIRYEEIGVRKAFGASAQEMARQLVVENIFITVIGGFAGIVLAFFFFAFISGSGYLILIDSFFYWQAVFYYLLIFIVMGAIAGIVPSYRLSKTTVTNALNPKK